MFLQILSLDLNFKMKPKILNTDGNYDEWCEEEIIKAYKEAAESDEFLFGDYDYEKEWLNNCGGQ
jgi:hypothetical protein